MNMCLGVLNTIETFTERLRLAAYNKDMFYCMRFELSLHNNYITRQYNYTVNGKKTYTEYIYEFKMQERRNSIANALELHRSCTNPSI